jgi:hypothetical protein
MNGADATLEEIWAIRRKIAEEFNYDREKMLEYYQRKQRESGAKMFDRFATKSGDTKG